MKMKFRIFTKLALTLFFLINSHDVSACEKGGLQEFIKIWKEFRIASLEKTPEEISKFYRFPLKLNGGDDDAKPILLSREIFLKHYDEIFKISEVGEEVRVFKELKKSREDDYNRSGILQNFDQSGCVYTHGSFAFVNMYNLNWTKDDGWKITSVDYADNYDDLIKTLKRWKAKH